MATAFRVRAPWLRQGALPALLAAVSALACNAVFDIEEGALVEAAGASNVGPHAGAGGGGSEQGQGGVGGDAGQGGQGQGGSSQAGSAQGGNAQGGAAGAGGGSSGQGGASGGQNDDFTTLPPGLVVDASPLSFTASLVTHAGSLVSGALTTYHSPLGTSITPDCPADPAGCFPDLSGDEVCVTGTTTPVPNDDFDNYWGGGVMIAIEREFEEPPVPAWDRAGGQVRGVAFTLSGTDITDASFNVGVPATASNMYPTFGVLLPATSPARYFIPFDRLLDPRWDPVNAATLPGETLLRNLNWEIGAVAHRGKSYTLCVSDIRLLVSAP